MVFRNAVRRLLMAGAVGLCVLFSGLACALDAQVVSNIPDFTVGACTHFGFRRGHLESNLSLIAQAGIASTRDEITWGSCEKEKGKLEMPAFYLEYIDKAVAAGIAPLTILNYGNGHYDDGGYPRSPEAIEGFCRYAEFVVNTLKERGVRYYQVWNEWDGGCGMRAEFKGTGDSASYVNLLRAVYPRIKAAYPEAVVIANPVCTGDGTLDAMLGLGMLEACDVVALHTYNYGSPATRSPENWLARMQRVEQMLRSHNGGKEVPLFITEMGWPTHVAKSGTPHEDSASYLARMYLMARTLPYIRGIWWYDFQDDGWKMEYNEDNFGLVRADNTPKSSYYLMRDISALAGESKLLERLDLGDENLWALRFANKDGSQSLAVWSAHDDDDWQFTLRNAAAERPALSIRRAGQVPYTLDWGARDWLAGRETPVQSDRLNLTVRGRPWIITGELAQTTVEKVVKRAFAEKMRPDNIVMFAPGEIGRVSAEGSAAIEYGLDSPEMYRSIGGQSSFNAADLSATFSLSYGAQALHLRVSVTDDVHNPAIGNDNLWQGDSLQIAFAPFVRRQLQGKDYMELDVALTGEGPVAFGRPGGGNLPVGKIDGLDMRIAREGDKTVYDIELPYERFGLPKLRAGGMFAFSLLINDADEKGRKGYLHWGDGIGNGKNPLEYNWMVLQ